jgi:hypothetical protein
METLTSAQYKGMLTTFQSLVRTGFKPYVARDIVLSATAEALKKEFVLQRRGFGQVGPGRCTRMNVTRDEEALRARVEQFRQRGWNITYISPWGTKFGRKEIVYACPPGFVPQEHQTQFMTGERF